MYAILALVGVIILFGLLIMYNARVLMFLSQTFAVVERLYLKTFGHRVRLMNLRLERKAGISRKSFSAKMNNYFIEIISNLDMAKDGVTPAGLLVFLATLGMASFIFMLTFTNQLVVSLLLAAVTLYFTVTVLRFASLMRFERREAEIMDTVDLLSMDIKGGVKNAIVRYTPSLHPNIKPYFLEFLDNINIRGYSFEQAMLLLSDRLGATFVDFAQKAILYEAKADKELEEIFSSIIEVNRHRRELRDRTNRKFAQLRADFLISGAVIVGYVLYAMWTDAYINNFIMNTAAGWFMIVFDIFLITTVLSYMAAIKARL